jgi:hypothetical protein
MRAALDELDPDVPKAELIRVGELVCWDHRCDRVSVWFPITTIAASVVECADQ